MKERLNINQQEYWDNQHKKRKQEFIELEQKPSDFAKKCLNYINPGAKILEIGIANGRDARYFIRNNKNIVFGVDISKEAISQLIVAANKDNTINNIFPTVADVNKIPELFKDRERFDIFYSRSSLHLDDTQLIIFFKYLIPNINQNGKIMIEGKTKEDFKINRSFEIGKNCYEDLDGHIRRVWSKENIESLCDTFNLNIIEIGNTTEVLKDKETKFIHFIANKK